MPMLQFKCSEGHEFEKIVPAKQELHKWCKHCDRLTIWREITDPHSELYRQKVCSDCLGNEHVAPMLPPPDVRPKEEFTAICPECGKNAEHVIRVELRGKDDIAHSSIRFHFNYMCPTDE